MLTNSKLWERIEGFKIDNSAAETPFSARLAREQGWSPEKTRAAIDEYKRFIYLTCVAASPLTPSAVVDEVWHFHLLYTRSYWTDLCEGVLGRPLHHEPARGRAPAYHFLDLYADTRSLYESEFGCAPPAEFWPLVSERFAPAAAPTDRESCWVAPKPSGLGSILWCLAGAVIAVLASGDGVAAAVQADAAAGGSRGLMLMLAAVVVLAARIVRHPRRPPRNDAGKDRNADTPDRGRSSGYWGCEG